MSRTMWPFAKLLWSC